MAVLALCALVLAGEAQARSIPTLSRRVTDEASVLGARAGALEQTLAVYEQKTGHQFAVLIIQSLDGEDLEGYSIKVAEQWRLGDKKRDDGLLLLVAMEDRAIRVEVGYGLEGAVPDAVASRVIRDIMIPSFRAGDPVGGIEQGLEALMKAAEGEAIGAGGGGAAPLIPPRNQYAPSPFVMLMPALFFLLVLLPVPRFLRALMFGLFCAFVFGSLYESLFVAGLAGGAGFVVGVVLPTIRPRGGGGRGGGSGVAWWLLSNAASSASRGGWSNSGGGFSGGGFSGGGGGFGGGGASGRW